VFKTRTKGWGVRSWDTIPVGSYVTAFVGKIHPLEYVASRPDYDDTFIFDLGKRSDMDWDNSFLHEGDE
jgi:euchromatic histone-lysine N-methyltransferase